MTTSYSRAAGVSERTAEHNQPLFFCSSLPLTPHFKTFVNDANLCAKSLRRVGDTAACCSNKIAICNHTDLQSHKEMARTRSV